MSTNQPGKPRVKFIDEAGETTEAHSTNQPGKPRVKFIDEAGETTEGHGVRGKGG